MWPTITCLHNGVSFPLPSPSLHGPENEVQVKHSHAYSHAKWQLYLMRGNKTCGQSNYRCHFAASFLEIMSPSCEALAIKRRTEKLLSVSAPKARGGNELPTNTSKCQDAATERRLQKSDVHQAHWTRKWIPRPNHVAT